MPFNSKKYTALARDYGDLIGLNTYVFLGSERHGLSAAEAMLYYMSHRTTGNSINKIFIEGFYYHPVDGVNMEKIKYSSDRNMLISFKKYNVKVIGLETEDASPSTLGVAELERFMNEKRCTVANPIWAEIIKSNTLEEGGHAAVCCGAAHLVAMKESSKKVEPLQSYFDPLDYTVRYISSDSTTFHAVDDRFDKEELLKKFPDMNEDDDTDDLEDSSD